MAADEEIIRKFEEMGLGTEEERARFLRMVPQYEPKEYEEQIFIRADSESIILVSEGHANA